MSDVVVLGSGKPGALGGLLVRGFGRLGTTCELVDDGAIGGGRYLRKARQLARVPSRGRHVADLVAERDPSVVVVTKGVHVGPPLLRELRRRSPRCRLVNWFPDDPFVGLPPRVPLAWLAEYDHVVTYSPGVLTGLAGRFPGREPLLIPFGFDPDDYSFPALQVAPTRQVGFVGQWNPVRDAILAAALSVTDSVEVRGPGWERSTSLREHWNPSPTYGPDVTAFYQQCAVGLNVLHPRNNAGSHNMRTFELPATGTAMLTTDTEQQRELLRDVGWVDYYRDEATFVQALRRLLGASPADRDPVLMQPHRYEHRCSALLEALA